ncbi:MAG: penicillin-binding protein 2 [Acidobacteriota bacterium]
MAARVKRTKKKNLKQIAFTRFMLIVAVFVIWIGGISVRLVHLQVKQHDELSDRAARQRQEVKRSKLLRGSIFDRNGRTMAMSVNVKTLYADATEISDAKAAAKSLAKALGQNEQSLFKLLSSAKEDDRRFVPIAKGLDETEVQKINKALEDQNIKKATSPKSEGLYWRDDQKRSYPNGSLAAHIIGFSNADGMGQAGIEQSQNEILYGAVIKRTFERDRLGRVYDEVVSEKEPPKDIVLTISNPIQFATERALERAVKASNARSGMAVVIANKTGEVLAMANYPTFDPNKISNADPEHFKNGVIQDVYSPGSVFKLVTYGSALERDLITPEGEVDSGNGTIEVARHRFRDSHSIGRVTYTKALAHSSNVCAIKTGMRVGREGFFDLVQKFGFGRPTGIELPAETGGLVRPPARWNGDSLASMSIGYEIGVSALQMATAFATIANDGVKIQPHIIKEIRQSDATIISSAAPESTRVVSDKTARDLRKMLREVVLSGTGRRAKLDGYSSAGKTGTAWKFDPVLKRVNPGKYTSSFVGFAPVDDPEVTIAVVMDEPKTGARDGGGVAAPVFREIADQILPQLNVPYDMTVTAENDSPDIIDIPESVGNGDELPATGDDKTDEAPPVAGPTKLVTSTALVKRAEEVQTPAVKTSPTPSSTTAKKAVESKKKRIDPPVPKTLGSVAPKARSSTTRVRQKT